MTHLSDIWNLPDGQRIILALNSDFQPINTEGGVFERFLGTVARQLNLCPLNYQDWRKVPIQYKDSCLKIIQVCEVLFSRYILPLLINVLQ